MISLLLIIGIVLLVLWVRGLISGRTLGGGVHVLLVIALILIIIWLLSAALHMF